MAQDKIKRAVCWRNAKEALHLAANSERLANFAQFPEETRQMHKRAAQSWRNMAAAELRKIPANFIEV